MRGNHQGICLKCRPNELGLGELPRTRYCSVTVVAREDYSLESSI